MRCRRSGRCRPPENRGQSTVSPDFLGRIRRTGPSRGGALVHPIVDPITVGEETRWAVDATLHVVLRYTGNVDAGRPGMAAALP